MSMSYVDIKVAVLLPSNFAKKDSITSVLFYLL